MDPCLFLPENFVCLSHHNTRLTISLDDVGLKICFLRTSNFMVTLTFFFPWCKLKWSWDEFNNQSQKNYRALGRLHGPCCKQPLSVMYTTCKEPRLDAYRSQSVTSVACQYDTIGYLR